MPTLPVAGQVPERPAPDVFLVLRRCQEQRLLRPYFLQFSLLECEKDKPSQYKPANQQRGLRAAGLLKQRPSLAAAVDRPEVPKLQEPT